MKQISTEINIDAPAPVIWSILTDFEQYPEWNPFITEVSGEAEENTRLRVRIVPPDSKGMVFKPTVIRSREAREFRWLGHLFFPGLFDGEHIFKIEPADEGKCRFIQREKFRGFLVPFLWSSLKTNTRRGFELMNEALKERAEQRTGSPADPA